MRPFLELTEAYLYREAIDFENLIIEAVDPATPESRQPKLKIKKTVVANLSLLQKLIFGQ